jgi:hypothetical protein
MPDGQKIDGIRVLPGSVQEYPSGVPSILALEVERLDEGVQPARDRIQDRRDRRLGNPLAQHHLDLSLFPVELRRAKRALRATEQEASGSRGGPGIPRP